MNRVKKILIISSDAKLKEVLGFCFDGWGYEVFLQDHPVERIRCGFWGLRTLVFLGYYGRPSGVQATGYRADPRGWEALLG